MRTVCRVSERKTAPETDIAEQRREAFWNRGVAGRERHFFPMLFLRLPATTTNAADFIFRQEVLITLPAKPCLLLEDREYEGVAGIFRTPGLRFRLDAEARVALCAV